jgi:hypothetical protein
LQNHQDGVRFRPRAIAVTTATKSPHPALIGRIQIGGLIKMKKTLAVLATIGAVAATAISSPAPAEARGIGPGLAFGLAAGALTAGAVAASRPYYYGPGYGAYYGPRYYYGPGPYAYYGGGPYYRHRYWRHHW